MKVLLFAGARQQLGANEVDVEVKLPTTVAVFREQFVTTYPEMASMVASSRFALNQKFVDDACVIGGDEELALIPPVSGG